MQIVSMNTPLKRVTREEAENVAVGEFSFITSDEERLGRFLAVSGLRPDTIRSDEPLLIALAKDLNTKPEQIMQAHWTLSPSEFE